MFCIFIFIYKYIYVLIFYILIYIFIYLLIYILKGSKGPSIGHVRTGYSWMM